MNRLSRRAQRGVLLLASFAVSVGLCEILLRHVGGVFHDTFMQPDLHRGWSLRPGFGGWVNGENVLWMQINRDGMRDHDHPLEAPPRTLRVAVLGDSYVQGLNVTPDKMFTTFLEERLNTCVAPSGLAVEVLNFGVSGYGTAQEWLTYRHHAAKYRPDLVVLAVYTNNDVYNNHRRLNPTDYSDQSPYFTLDGETLVLDDSFRAVLADREIQPWWRRARMAVTDRVRVAQLGYQVWGMVRPALIGDPFADEDDGTEGIDLEEAAIYLPPAVPELEDAWRVTEAIIRQWAADVRQDGAEPWLVTLANGPQLEPDPAERQRFLDQVGVASLDYPDQRLARVAGEHGIASVALAEPLADYAVRNRAYLNGGYREAVPFGAGHWNEHGNRVAAELLGDRLCADPSRVASRLRR